MKFKKNVLCLAFLSISCSSFAASVKSSTIYLGQGGTVNPRETLSIPLDKLVAGGSYHITCKIADPNNQKNKVSMVFSTYNNTMPGSLGGSIVLNGNNIGSGNSQTQLTQANNIIEFFSMSQTNGLIFTNLDQDDSVTVSDCIATAE